MKCRAVTRLQIGTIRIHPTLVRPTNAPQTYPRPALLAQVIRKMAEHIQPPDPERFKWERHTSVIEPSGFRQNVGGVWEGDNDAEVLGHRWASRSWSGAGLETAGGASAMLSFWRVIAAAAEDPVPPLPVSATVLRGQARGGKFGYILYAMKLLFPGVFDMQCVGAVVAQNNPKWVELPILRRRFERGFPTVQVYWLKVA